MIQGIDASAERFLSALDQINDRVARAEREISSGRRINTVSDHPDEVSAALAAHAELAQTLQIGLNLGRANAEAQTAEQSISEAVKLLDRLSQLAVQAASETQSPKQRTAIAVEVGAILTQLVSIAGTQVEGRYIFSGDSDQAPPYTMLPGPPPAVSPYAGTASTRKVMHPNGTLFDLEHTAEQILDAAGASAFAAVSALKTALENAPAVPEGDPAYAAQYHGQTAQIDAALAQLRQARDHVNEELAYCGVVQARVDEATEYSQKLEVRQRTELSSIQDADLTSSILELTQATAHRDTALAARARMPSKSLFEYL